MSEKNKTLTLSEADFNRLGSILEYIFDTEVSSFDEYMVEHFDNDYDSTDEQFELALNNDDVHHIFKTAELLARALDEHQD